MTELETFCAALTRAGIPHERCEAAIPGFLELHIAVERGADTSVVILTFEDGAICDVEIMDSLA